MLLLYNNITIHCSSRHTAHRDGVNTADPHIHTIDSRLIIYSYTKSVYCIAHTSSYSYISMSITSQHHCIPQTLHWPTLLSSVCRLIITNCVSQLLKCPQQILMLLYQTCMEIHHISAPWPNG